MPFIICLSRRDFNARAKERRKQFLKSNEWPKKLAQTRELSRNQETRNSQLVWSLCREQLTNKFHFSLTLLCQRIGATTSTIVERNRTIFLMMKSNKPASIKRGFVSQHSLTRFFGLLNCNQSKWQCLNGAHNGSINQLRIKSAHVKLRVNILCKDIHIWAFFPSSKTQAPHIYKSYNYADPTIHPKWRYNSSNCRIALGIVGISSYNSYLVDFS